MSDKTKQKSGGLADVVAGETAISAVRKEGIGLTYRGYSIQDLAEKATFEEVAYLLLYGAPPNESQLREYRHRLIELRGLPEPLKEVLERLPAASHPMDVLRTACSVLGCLEPERRFSDQNRAADRLLAAFPGAALLVSLQPSWPADRSAHQPAFAGRTLSSVAPRQAARARARAGAGRDADSLRRA